jgi:hypothetical protein
VLFLREKVNKAEKKGERKKLKVNLRLPVKFKIYSKRTKKGPKGA